MIFSSNRNNYRLFLTRNYHNDNIYWHRNEFDSNLNLNHKFIDVEPNLFILLFKMTDSIGNIEIN